MGKTGRHSLIERLQTEMPQTAPFDLSTLSRAGISAKQAAHYAATGSLIRLAYGVYARPGAAFDPYDTVKFLQGRVPNLHIGGKSALGQQGVRKNLYSHEPFVLWGSARLALPEWFASRFPARYVSARLFNWQDESLNSKSLSVQKFGFYRIRRDNFR